jgi:hypothetical protein
MILSHKYKFIFLKTNKTAGTSVELALSKYCGAEDIITPVTPQDEELRRSLGHPGPQNHCPSFSDYSRRDWLVAMRRFKRKRFYNHMPAREIKLLVGDEIWNSYFKFCFERNPWDRMISLYWWRCKTEPRPAISEFIDSPETGDLTDRGIGIYTIGGKLAVDRVFLYENIEAELASVCNHLGLPEKPSLPRAKSSHRVDKRHYRDVLSPHDREKIAARFDREISLFGYQF